MTPEHTARITWSEEQVRRGLPTVLQTIDPSWLASDPKGADGWSLVCRFDEPPRQQGNPSIAHVRFLVDEAPHTLRPGTCLMLFEKWSTHYARVEIID
jgi:hypothetical protein